MKKDTIKAVNFEKDDVRAALEMLRRNTEALIEYSQLKAKIRRQSFLAHIEQGFTEEQALELCKEI